MCFFFFFLITLNSVRGKHVEMISTSAYKGSKVLWKWKSQINSWRSMLPGILSLSVAKPKLRRGVVLVNQEGTYYSYRGLRSNSPHLATKGKVVCPPWIQTVVDFPWLEASCLLLTPCNYPAESQAARDVLTSCESAASLGVWCGFCVRHGADREGEEAGWEGQGDGKKLLDNFSGSSFTV